MICSPAISIPPKNTSPLRRQLAAMAAAGIFLHQRVSGGWYLQLAQLAVLLHPDSGASRIAPDVVDKLLDASMPAMTGPLSEYAAYARII